jgi:hypothetical protein
VTVLSNGIYWILGEKYTTNQGVLVSLESVWEKLIFPATSEKRLKVSQRDKKKLKKEPVFSCPKHKDECYNQRPVPAFAAMCLCLRIPVVYPDGTGSVHVAGGCEGGEVMGGAAWWWYPAHSGQTLLEVR